MKKKKGRRLLDDVLSMLGDRAIHWALIFSLAAHGAVMILLRDWPAAPLKKKPAMIVARLIRLSDSLPDGERGTGEEEVSQGEDQRLGAAEDEDMAEPLPSAEGGGEGVEPSLGASGLTARAGVAAAGAAGMEAGRGRRLAGRISPSPPVRASGKGALTLPLHGPGAAERGGSVEAALAEIRRRVESKKRYPLLARRRGWEGEVLVELRLGVTGELESLRLLQPSGFPLLDRATIRAVESAVPFPPLAGTVRIPVTYDLEE